jgi:hypothetical protein
LLIFYIVLASRASWEDISSRRELFVKYAKENGFDPLNPENWYLQPRKKILEIKVFNIKICVQTIQIVQIIQIIMVVMITIMREKK